MWKEDVTQLPSLSYLETNCLNHAITCPLLWWILFGTFEYFSCLETKCLNHAITLLWWILFETFWYFSMLYTNYLNHAITCFDVYFLKLLNIFSILSTNCLNHAITFLLLWCILFETFEYFFNTEYWLPQPCNHILNKTLFEYTSDCLLVAPYAALPGDCAIRWLVVWLIWSAML